MNDNSTPTRHDPTTHLAAKHIIPVTNSSPYSPWGCGSLAGRVESWLGLGKKVLNCGGVAALSESWCW